MAEHLQIAPEIVFVPKYRWTLTAGPLLFLLTIPLGVVIFAESDFQDLGVAAVFLLCWTMSALVLLILPRRMRFAPRELIVERLLGQRRIPYTRIKDIGFGMIEVRGGLNVPLRELKNADELYELLDRLAEASILPVDEFEGTLEERMTSALRMLFWTVPVAIAAGGAVLWFDLTPPGWDPAVLAALASALTFAVAGVVHHLARRH